MVSVALVYDGSIRDNGTGFYLRLAAAQHFGHEVDWYTEDPSAQQGGIPHIHDFYIAVDDGRDDLPVDGIPHPWGYWIVDSHLGPDIRIAKAKQADLVWCAQKPFVAELAKHGVKARWLPLACEPQLHISAAEAAIRKVEADFPGRDDLVYPTPEPEFNLAFVGHLGDPGRLEFLDQLFTAFPNSWYAYGCFHEDMAAQYHKAQLGINHAVRDDLNMRFFELASMGVPQLAPEFMVGLDDIGAVPGVHFWPYADAADAIDTARMALSSPKRMQEMAKQAQALVRSRHTYRHRLCTMMKDIESFLRGTPACNSSDSPASPEGSPLS